jgi:hypothetical protein
MQPVREMRRQDWWMRLEFPSTLAAPLGWGTEYWRRPTEFPEYVALVEASQRLGYPINPILELTDNLLRDVVSAAAAIEFTVERIEAATATAQSQIDSMGTASPELEPEYGVHAAVEAISPAYLDFNNLLSWIRALEERIRRREPISRRQVGLLPSQRSWASSGQRDKTRRRPRCGPASECAAVG